MLSAFQPIKNKDLPSEATNERTMWEGGKKAFSSWGVASPESSEHLKGNSKPMCASFRRCSMANTSSDDIYGVFKFKEVLKHVLQRGW